jgi:hypothetical protein
MKVRLLNDGGFFGLQQVKFPVEVEATSVITDAGNEAYGVPYSELIRIGANAKSFDDTGLWYWLPNCSEAEPVE